MEKVLFTLKLRGMIITVISEIMKLTEMMYLDGIMEMFTSGNFLLSIHSWEKQLSITCILANKESDFDKTYCTIYPVLYETSDFKVTNIIFSLNDDEVSSGKKLFLKISINKVPSEGESLDLFIREKSFKIILKTQTLKKAFTYTSH